MNTSVPFTQLSAFKTNYRENKASTIFETNQIVIELNHLDEFLTQAKTKPGCDAIKIHFIRYPLNANQGHVHKIPNMDLSQVLLAIVPARITDRDDWTADDVKDGDNIFTLFVCMPAANRATIDDKTGACPPKPPGCQ